MISMLARANALALANYTHWRGVGCSRQQKNDVRGQHDGGLYTNLGNISVECQRIRDPHGVKDDHGSPVSEEPQDRHLRDFRKQGRDDVRDRVSDDDAERYHSAERTVILPVH